MKERKENKGKEREQREGKKIKGRKENEGKERK